GVGARRALSKSERQNKILNQSRRQPTRRVAPMARRSSRVDWRNVRPGGDVAVASPSGLRRIERRTGEEMTRNASDRKNRWGLVLAGGDAVHLKPLTRLISGD